MFFYKETSELIESVISYQLSTDKKKTVIFTKQLKYQATNCELSWY